MIKTKWPASGVIFAALVLIVLAGIPAASNNARFQMHLDRIIVGDLYHSTSSDFPVTSAAAGKSSHYQLAIFPKPENRQVAQSNRFKLQATFTRSAVIDRNCRPGEINGDGLINMADMVLLIRQLYSRNTVAVEADFCSCDVNCDGVFNIRDATALMKHLYKGMNLPCSSNRK